MSFYKNNRNLVCLFFLSLPCPISENISFLKKYTDMLKNFRNRQHITFYPAPLSTTWKRISNLGIFTGLCDQIIRLLMAPCIATEIVQHGLRGRQGRTHPQWRILGWSARDAPGPNSFIFMQFSGKFGQIIGFCPILKFGPPPPSQKSWIRHCIPYHA